MARARWEWKFSTSVSGPPLDPDTGEILPWASVAVEADLDDFLEDGQAISGMQIEDLLAFVRLGGQVVNIKTASNRLLLRLIR